jgi:predicted N-acetyltransferase YhbS
VSDTFSKRTTMRTDYPRGKRDIAELSPFLARVFVPQYGELIHLVDHHHRGYGGLKPHFTRILRRNGRIVAHVGVHELRLRIGAATLRMGGIAGVACEPQYRRAGLAAHCMNDAIAVMRKDGLPLSMLAGIDRYYLRFGYIGCLPRFGLKLQLKHLQALKNPFAVELFKPADLAKLTELYNLAAQATPGSLVRDRQYFASVIKRWKLLGDGNRPAALYVFRQKNSARTIRAYAIWKDNSFWEAAMAPGDETACAAVLAWLRQKREELVEKELDLSNLCPAHPLYAFALRFNHTESRIFSWSGAWMGCVLDVARFLKELRSEFEARWAAALPEGSCKLRLRVDGAAHTVTLGDEGLPEKSAQVSCTQQALLQMTLGTLSADAIPDVKIAGDTRVVAALFPAATPNMYRLDNF